MKKVIIILSIAVLGFSASAQDSLVVNKNGVPVLPKKGDIGIGLEGNPFFNYVGNMFNSNTNNSLNLGDNTLYFRYFLKDDAAVRIRLRIASTSSITNYNVIDDAARAQNPLSNKEVEDRTTIKNNDYELHIGYQQFRGYNRLKGFYGADLGFGYYKLNEKFEYGNKMSELNPAPTTAIPGITAGDRITERVSNSPSKAVSLGVFAGAEYYFMPKICVGLELGLSYGKTWYGQEYTKREHMVGSVVETYDKVDRANGSSYRSLTTQFPYSYGSLYFMIHF